MLVHNVLLELQRGQQPVQRQMAQIVGVERVSVLVAVRQLSI